MLSTEAIGNASQAKHYFLEQDNYYIEDREAKERSDWWGKGAKALELSGEVDAEVFTTLLKGQLPHGQQLGVKLEGDIKHRPGFDLTFSVPKSVSLLALMGDDKRILGAVQQAVDKALAQIEQGCAQARVTQEGVTIYQNTQNLVVAKFLHDISREGDPQLHVHCVVMNMTQRRDGQWRSLSSRSSDYGAEVSNDVNGFLERVRHHKHYYGLLFRAELAYELKQLGYTLSKTGKDGFFEVEGISQKTLDAYSQRSQQIDAYMQEHGYLGAKAAAVATLKTRKAKNINRDTLHELWQSRSDYYQLDAFSEAVGRDPIKTWVF
jgi:conjugative relaxase-like TrwC/TraI family protein